jgi:ribonuclease HI
MSKKRAAYYVVWQGRTPGIYDSWEACEAQVKGADGARYKGFATLPEAQQAFAASPDDYIVKKVPTTNEALTRPTTNEALTGPTTFAHPLLPALAVDAACSGNPGLMEFRGVVADTGTEVFHRGPYPAGTNNIGEFLALVLGLAYLKKHNLPWNLYSDSRTALAWLRKGHAETKLVCTAENQELFLMLRKAEQWLHDNTWTTTVLKWDTEHWGEIPADFGRK